MRANLTGRPHYSETIGPLVARVVLTINSTEFFWRVEVITGTGPVRLEQADGTSKRWPLIEVEKAKKAAREFALSLLKQEKIAA